MTPAIFFSCHLAERQEPPTRHRAGHGQAGGRGKKKPSGTLPEGFESNGHAPQTRDKLAEAVGMSARTLDKAMAVVEAAKADPEKFGDLPAKMPGDRPGVPMGEVYRAAATSKGSV